MVQIIAVNHLLWMELKCKSSVIKMGEKERKKECNVRCRCTQEHTESGERKKKIAEIAQIK